MGIFRQPSPPAPPSTNKYLTSRVYRLSRHVSIEHSASDGELSIRYKDRMPLVLDQETLEKLTEILFVLYGKDHWTRSE